MAKLNVMENFIQKLQRKIQNKITDVQWSIEYFEREDPEVMRDEIKRLKGVIGGLNFLKIAIPEVLKDIEHQGKFDEFVNKMNSGLDKMNEILNQPKS